MHILDITMFCDYIVIFGDKIKIKHHASVIFYGKVELKLLENYIKKRRNFIYFCFKI